MGIQHNQRAYRFSYITTFPYPHMLLAQHLWPPVWRVEPHVSDSHRQSSCRCSTFCGTAP